MSEHPAKSLADHGREYDETREQTLSQIRNGELSVTMSGIEYRMQPWAKLSNKEQTEYAKSVRAHEERQAIRAS